MGSGVLGMRVLGVSEHGGDGHTLGVFGRGAARREGELAVPRGLADAEKALRGNSFVFRGLGQIRRALSKVKGGLLHNEDALFDVVDAPTQHR